MDAILAIAALCQIGSGSAAKFVEARQLSCQKQLIECYFQKGAQIKNFDPMIETTSAGATKRKFLYECVADRTQAKARAYNTYEVGVFDE